MKTKKNIVNLAFLALLLTSTLVGNISLGGSTPPGNITDLKISGATISSVTLTWFAVGDDGYIGKATAYDMRQSSSTFVLPQWTSLTQVTGLPAPGQPGTTETFTVTGLTAGNTYYFAVRARDDAGNLSASYNIVRVTTSGVAATPSPTAIPTPTPTPTLTPTQTTTPSPTPTPTATPSPTPSPTQSVATPTPTFTPSTSSSSSSSVIPTQTPTPSSVPSSGNQTSSSPQTGLSQNPQMPTLTLTPTTKASSQDSKPIFSGTSLRRTLRRGVRGEDVKRLQLLLNNLGIASLTPDGVFGRLTHTATQAFQRQYRLVPDGIVGIRTLRIIELNNL